MISPVAAPAPARQQSHSRRFPEFSVRLEKDLVQVFKLLADETRLKVLLYLMQEGELHVSALCERLHQSQPAVSHHLALLREAGLIEPRRDGKHNFYSVKKSKFHHLIQQLFDSMSYDGNGEVRFDDFILTQQ
jgi:ArsR family transcriptional regulator